MRVLPSLLAAPVRGLSPRSDQAADVALDVLILKADRLSAESLQRHVQQVFPAAKVCLASRLEQAAAIISSGNSGLFLTGVRILDGDVLDFLAGLPPVRSEAMRTLVVTSRKDFRVLAGLRSLPIKGVFDSLTEGPKEFAKALGKIVSGQHYWSPSVLAQLERYHNQPNSLARILTPMEQLVFALIGDGAGDEDVARQLGLKRSTIAAVRRDLHRKLGVQHKGELLRLALQHGFVRFEPHGTVRPGLAQLTEAWRKTRRGRNRLK